MVNTMNRSVIIKNVIKKYDNIIALNDVSMSINSGEIFGLIGPDGSGKTSLIRIIASLLIQESGKVEVCGYDNIKDHRQIRNILGYMPGKFSLYTDLTVKENITLFASIFGTTLEENYYLVKDIYSQIEPFENRAAGALSGGMKQKLALSCALIHKPEILLLDEPTTGVDAVSRKEFWQMLKKLKEIGITIIVSTPYMDEASQCERVALMQKGKILDLDSPDSIVGKYSKKLYAVTAENKYRLLGALRSYDYTDSVYPFGEYLHYTDVRGSVDKSELAEYLGKNKNDNVEVKDAEPDIEDCFMERMVDDDER